MSGQVQRHVQLVNVAPGMRDTYLRLHANVWPQVEARLTASNIVNYSIFIHGELLVAYFEYAGDDFLRDMALIAEDSSTRAWWALTDPCQSPLESAGPGSIWAEAEEVWHLA
jgi:L-rhamnose mutarotase